MNLKIKPNTTDNKDQVKNLDRSLHKNRRWGKLKS